LITKEEVMARILPLKGEKAKAYKIFLFILQLLIRENGLVCYAILTVDNPTSGSNDPATMIHFRRGHRPLFYRPRACQHVSRTMVSFCQFVPQAFRIVIMSSFQWRSGGYVKHILMGNSISSTLTFTLLSIIVISHPVIK
jgi:hypothetical protein